ncbi:MAG: ATP-binding cassette domain-containing protein [Bacilli bacterium]
MSFIKDKLKKQTIQKPKKEYETTDSIFFRLSEKSALKILFIGLISLVSIIVLSIFTTATSLWGGNLNTIIVFLTIFMILIVIIAIVLLSIYLLMYYQEYLINNKKVAPLMLVKIFYRTKNITGYPDNIPTVDPLNGKEILLQVVDASIHFKVGRKIIKACSYLNFKVYKGETFGLVGESGSGKTTITRAILGINKLETGAIYFRGENISRKMKRSEKMKLKKNIQMIFQDPAASLNERANIDYIISEGLYNFKLFNSQEERLKKVTDMLDEVSLLPEHLSRYPHEFSGGQRQRIGIARALVIEPELVLADEPISALDVSIRAQVLNLLKKLQHERGLTYIFIAHDLSIIRYISDRIAVMHQGYIVELGDANKIYANPVHPYTKALLTAIPQPDPKTKEDRIKLVYDKGDIDYAKCKWLEPIPGHYVLAPEDKIDEWMK